MRAVWLTAFGGPEVLVPGEAEEPVPGDGQVRIEVEYANVTFVETQMRGGMRGPFRVVPPLIPGNGVGGVDDKGRRVVASTGGAGGYAEVAVADRLAVHAVPDGLPLDHAVALLADGRTATLQFQAAEPQEGERVLVEAAAGGVGSLLVQLAKNAGLTVVAAVGDAGKARLARELGADEVVLYREEGWEKAVGDVDIVFDGVGGDIGRKAFTTLRSEGRMASYGLAGGEWAGITQEQADERHVVLVSTRPDPAMLRQATLSALTAGAAGVLRPVIGQRFPLERAADAHRAIEARATTGKTLLDVR
ncbi:zinc-binding dehydrogenase [Actinomadura rayongensis]|uniref:Zinc-binding dehydrogenase n=1 Tax=Actinomadura rayongensis TaxID=1429076 RepID=A0A6I4W0E4_9ACTN|nr:zinc-binding dehydrogenase [Actinomadura rayongensis]MXQ62983.1 zinc-binding dehydrogenase [Actinomadura rayongensis]